MNNLVTVISSMLLIGSPVSTLSKQSNSQNLMNIQRPAMQTVSIQYPDFFSLNWTGNVKGYAQLNKYSFNEKIVFDFQISSSKPAGFDARKFSVVIMGAEKIPQGLNFETTPVDENGVGQIILTVDESFAGSEYATYNFTTKVKYEDKVLINSDKAITLEGRPKNTSVEGNPDQEVPGDKEPGTDAPGKEDPDQEVPGDKEPGTETPDKEDPDQELPGDKEPGTDAPDKEDPDQEVPGDKDPDVNFPEIELPEVSNPELSEKPDKDQEIVEIDKDTKPNVETGKEQNQSTNSNESEVIKSGTAEISDKDIDSNQVKEKLPQTSEESPLMMILLGLILITISVDLFVNLKLRKKTE